MASAWGLSWGNSWGNSWGTIRRAGGAFILTRKEMAALLRQERRYRREKRDRERKELEEELSLSLAIERAYRKVIGLPEDDETPLEVIAEALETTQSTTIEEMLAHLRASEDFERFLDLIETQRRIGLLSPGRRRRKLKALILAA